MKSAGDPKWRKALRAIRLRHRVPSFLDAPIRFDGIEGHVVAGGLGSTKSGDRIRVELEVAARLHGTRTLDLHPDALEFLPWHWGLERDRRREVG